MDIKVDASSISALAKKFDDASKAVDTDVLPKLDGLLIKAGAFPEGTTLVNTIKERTNGLKENLNSLKETLKLISDGLANIARATTNTEEQNKTAVDNLFKNIAEKMPGLK